MFFLLLLLLLQPSPAAAIIIIISSAAAAAAAALNKDAAITITVISFDLRPMRKTFPVQNDRSS
jgi:hypothetical protein